MDEQFDDFLLGHAGVQRYPQLPAERLMGAECGGDGDRDERATAVIESAARPRVAEGVDGGQTPKVLPHRRLAIAQREDERLAEQSLSVFQRLPVVVLTGHAWSTQTLIKAMSPMLAHCHGDRSRSRQRAPGRRFVSRTRPETPVPSLFRLMLINTAKRHQPTSSEFPAQ